MSGLASHSEIASLSDIESFPQYFVLGENDVEFSNPSPGTVSSLRQKADPPEKTQLLTKVVPMARKDQSTPAVQHALEIETKGCRQRMNTRYDVKVGINGTSQPRERLWTCF